MHVLLEILAGLLPSIGIGYLFYRIMRVLLEGDRKERAAYARWQAEHDSAEHDSGGHDSAVGGSGVTGTVTPTEADSRPTAARPENHGASTGD
ncbi:hypothetical protein [Mobilicoccus sp.]|uniref:hypothetical protein n=1 Tax=Mobilicoccus sp. TaxID=2034349 RepID=UPI00289E533F|nr:hypothetical protein [Mobilicoccus sp.]